MAGLDLDKCRRTAARATRAGGNTVECTGFCRHNASLAAARFRLHNGLTLVLMQDPRAPVFAYQSWFKVGSKHEDPKRTGLAHLFEHLMFKGTRRHPTGELDRELERRGGQTNAATWVDWTYYTEALAARDDNLETVADFEVDRMRGLLLDEATFKSELDVVKNERRMSVDDSIGGTLQERLYATAFSVHPYRWTTIGAMEHLAAATLDELREFYRTYYAPNNAVVVVAGDIDLEATLVLLARHYGELGPHGVPARTLEQEPEQSAPREVTMRRPLNAPQMVLGFHGPAQASPTFAALEMLNTTLVGGDNGRLYRRLVTEEQLATEVGGYATPFADPGLYELSFVLRPGVDPSKVLALVQEELDRLQHGIEAWELAKARNALELALLDTLREAQGAAETLGHHEVNCGDFARAFTTLGRYRDQSEQGLLALARRVLRPENRTCVVALPEGAAP